MKVTYVLCTYFFYEGCENEGEVDAEGETQKIQIQARDTDVHLQDLYFLRYTIAYENHISLTRDSFFDASISGDVIRS